CASPQVRMVWARRCTTCRTLTSCPVSGTPALRKYLLTMMSVASWDHAAGTSTSSIWNTTDPSGLVITVRRLSHRTLSSGFTPGWVKRRGTRSPAPVGRLELDEATALASIWVIADLPGPRRRCILPCNREAVPPRAGGSGKGGSVSPAATLPDDLSFA